VCESITKMIFGRRTLFGIKIEKIPSDIMVAGLSGLLDICGLREGRHARLPQQEACSSVQAVCCPLEAHSSGPF